MSYWLGRRMVNAECRDCGKRWVEANAQGVGAQHGRKYGHCVAVEIVQYVFYGRSPHDEEPSDSPPVPPDREE